MSTDLPSPLLEAQERAIARLLEADAERKQAHDAWSEKVKLRQARIMECREAGMSAQQIAEVLGVTRRWVMEMMAAIQKEWDQARLAHIDWMAQQKQRYNPRGKGWTSK